MVEDREAIVEISVCNEFKQCNDSSVLLDVAEKQLREYFDCKRKKFDFPIHPMGSDFSKKVWQKLCDIPYGATKTYGEIAKELDIPKAARAVGGACNKNPVMIVVPCHRVVGTKGKLVGYAFGIEAKAKLLKIETSL